MDLWKYSGKRIKITAIDGQVFIGFGDHYTSEHDNPEGVATLSLAPDGEKGILVELEESEIISIEIIPTASALVSAI